MVNIGQDEYVKQVGDTAGLRLVVHTQDKMPFPEDEGIMVTPGIATSIGLRQVCFSTSGTNKLHLALLVFCQIQLPVHKLYFSC